MTPTRSSQPTPPARPATQQDVAQAAGVSRGLVSLALKGEGRMADRTRQRILDAAERLRYSPNTAAAELASRRSRRLAVVVPYLDNPYFDRLLRALRQHATAAGYVLAAFVSDLTDQVERATINDVLSLRPAGLVLLGTSLSASELNDLARQLPLVVIDQLLPAGADPAISSVRPDEEAAAGLIMDHFAQEGVERIVFFAPGANMYESLVEERRFSCRAAARRAGIRFSSVTCDGGAGQALRTARLAQSRPSGGVVGAVAYNDVLAVDVCTSLLAAGWHPGRDISLVSFDNSSLASRRGLELSSIDQDPDTLAAAAVEALVNPQEQAGTRVTVTPSLTVRASSRVRRPQG